MLDVKLIRSEPEKVKKGIAAKNVSSKLVDDFLSLDEEWRKLTKEAEELRSRQKKLGEERKIGEAKELKEKLKVLESDLKAIENKREAMLGEFPNLPFDDVPIGADESGNKVLHEAGEKPEFDFKPRDYLELGEKLDLIDVKKAGEVSGSRFGYLKNEAVLMEFGLVNLALETLVHQGFIPVVPPVIVKPETMLKMGKKKFLEDKDAFHLAEDNLYLVGSSEQSIGPLHMDETLGEKELPKRYVGFSTCFRREAGSYGKDTRGILRVHQFDKVEMFSFAKPEDSEKEHQFLLSLQENFIQRLKLPYRVVEVCTGDMGWGDARQYDIETWLPSQEKYRETHSASNTTDFQARGVNTKYKLQISNLEPRTNFVHMLNATAFSQRPILAILENYQTKDGKVAVPEVLQKYVGKKIIG